MPPSRAMAEKGKEGAKPKRNSDGRSSVITITFLEFVVPLPCQLIHRMRLSPCAVSTSPTRIAPSLAHSVIGQYASFAKSCRVHTHIHTHTHTRILSTHSSSFLSVQFFRFDLLPCPSVRPFAPCQAFPADLRDQSTMVGLTQGVAAVCCCTGTTAFPSSR